MEAPRWFLEELKAFDPDLRLRWSPRLELWQIERRVRRSLHPGTIRCDGWHDDYVRARDGYVLVGSLPHRNINRNVFQILRNSDLWANGGWEKVADTMDEFEKEHDEQVWSRFQENCRYQAAELYDLMKIRDGRTVFNSGSFDGI